MGAAASRERFRRIRQRTGALLICGSVPGALPRFGRCPGDAAALSVYNQLVAAEKKLRAFSAIKLDQTFIKSEDIVENVKSNIFFAKISIDIPEILYQDINADFGRLIYTAGYIIAEIIQHIGCKICVSCLTFNEAIDDDKFYEYISSLTRNGLKIPSNDLVDLLYRCQIIFEKYIMPYASSDMALLNRANLIQLF